MNDTLYIIIPAYNESANITDVINDWYPIIEKHNGNQTSRLVIIDDGSTDGTYNLLSREAIDLPLLKVIRKGNTGHGATVLFGYRYAITKKADFIFQTDSDGQTRPEEFEQFWENRNDYDMVIGWRKGRQDGISRIFVTKTLKAVIRLCFGVNIKDANTPYRLMKSSTLDNYIDLIPDGFNLSNIILSVIYAKKNCKVKYIPITFRPRQGGVNSINLRKIWKIGKQALKDFRHINKTLK